MMFYSEVCAYCFFEETQGYERFILKIKMSSTMLSSLRSWFSLHVLDTLRERERERESTSF